MNKSQESYVCANSDPVLEKYAFVEFTKSKRSTVLANVLGASMGCFIIVYEI